MSGIMAGMARLLAFPFRVDPVTRGAAWVDAGSDAEVNQAIALHVLTHEGERPLRPTFGMEPVPFTDGVDGPGLQLQLAEHGYQDVQVTTIDSEDTNVPGAIRTLISWERA